jgi:hypothetical protein
MASNVTIPEGFRVVSQTPSIPDGFKIVSQESTKEPHKTFGDYFLDELSDIGYGVKKGLSGATLGASDWALRKLGVTDEDYLKTKKEQGLDKTANTIGNIAEFGGNFIGATPAIVKGVAKTGLKGLKALATEGGIIGGIYGGFESDKLKDLPQNITIGSVTNAVLPIGTSYALKPVAKAVKPLVNRYNQLKGLKEFKKQISKVDDFSDVNLGNIDDKLATELNAIRNTENVSPVQSSKVVATSDGIKHIKDSRSNYSNEKIVETLDNSLFSKDNMVAKGNKPENQIIFDKSNPSNKAIVSRDNNTGDIYLVSSMKDKSLGKKIKNSGGRPTPPYAVDNNVTKPAVGANFRFSSSSDDIIAQNIENVNNNYGTKSFVEALADKDKSRTLKNAVMSGEDSLAEKARVLQDALERRKSGMFDEELEALVKTPELRSAEYNYASFLNKNGDKVLSKDRVAEYYLNNPVAVGLLEEARAINPQAFAGVKKGSLKEFDILKQELRNSRSAGDTIGKPRQDALKRAENSLKNLMDDSFSGFRDVNSNLAKAKTNQDIFEGKLKKGLTSVGNATVSPFWSGISSPLAAAGVVGGTINPATLAATAGGLGGKALMRHFRRQAGRDVANGVIKTPIEISPLLSLGLSGAVVDSGFDYNRNRKQLLIDLLNNE